MKVLIADDDAVSRLVLARAVERLGCDAVVAEDGDDALRLARAEGPDVVISDWRMPRMDGLELCALLRADDQMTSYPYFILLTAHEGSDSMSTAMEAGADDFLTKPVDLDRLSARLIAADRVTSLQRELRERHRELEVAESRFRGMFESSAIAIAVCDIEGRLVSGNAALARFLGRPLTDLIGRTSADVTHPDDPIIDAEAMTQLLDSGQAVAAEKRFLRPDGSIVWGRSVVSVVPAADASGPLVMFMIEDRTAAKESEARERAHRATVDLLLRVAQASNEAATFDEAAKACVDAVCAFTGWPVGTLYKRSAHEHAMRPTAIWHVDDPVRFDLFRDVTEASAAAAATGLVGEVVRTAAPVWAEDVTQQPGFTRSATATRCGLRSGVACPVLLGGQPIAVLEFFSDELAATDPGLLDVLGMVTGQLAQVAERARADAVLRASEERTRLIIEKATEPFVEIGVDGRIANWNAAAERLYGWSYDEAVGREALELLAPRREDGAQNHLIALVESMMESGESGLQRIETTGRRRDGREFPVELSIWQVEDSEGAPSFSVFVRDITERRLAEEAIRASEARFRALVHNASDVIVVLAADGSITWASPSAERVLGYAHGSRTGDTALELVHRDDRDVAAQMMAEAFASPGEPVQAELRVLGADGGATPVEVIVTNLLHDPDVGGLVLNIRDITERKRAERALQEKTHALEAAVEGIASADVNGTYVSANAAFCRTVGYTPDEVRGLQWTDIVHPDDLDRIAEAAMGLFDGGEVSTEVRGVRKDGSVFHMSTFIVALHDEHGEVTGFQSFMKDVTEQKQAEERFRRAFDDSVLGMVLTTPDRRIVRVNRAALEITGMREDELVGGEFGSLTYPDDLPDDVAYVAALLAGAAVPERREKRLLRPDGSVVWIESATTLLRDASGAPVNLVVQFQDIASRKETEAELAHRATHDALTGLANRALLGERLRSAHARVQRHGGWFAVVYLDLDGFKAVNDDLGHAAGDELLVAVARRLSGVLRPTDTAARLGGDEFVVLCEDLDRPSDAEAIAERIDAVLAESVVLTGGGAIALRASLGIALGDAGTDDTDAVLRQADAAMYERKRHRRADVRAR